MSSMAELVHDIIPQSTNPQTVPERIEWVNIQKCSNGLLYIALFVEYKFLVFNF